MLNIYYTNTINNKNMETFDLLMIIDISLIPIIFIGSLIWRYKTRPINLIFQNKKFHIDYEDKKCEVISFEGLNPRTFRKNGNYWFAETSYNLAEWTWASKGQNHWLQN